jgi:hypothetical protein
MEMKKKIIFIMIPVLIVGVSIAGYYYFHKEPVTLSKATSPNGDNVIQVHEQNSTVEREFPMDMFEEDVQSAIHRMSHQKIEADQKWGALPLTPERVNRLIQVVENNQKNYINADLYFDILKRWLKVDFSHVAQDHNAIWELQGGTIGRATGIATPEEEKAFLKANFHTIQ